MGKTMIHTVHDLYDKLDESNMVMKTYDTMPSGIDLAVAVFPFCLSIEGKQFLVLDEHCVDRCYNVPPSQEYLDKNFNCQSDATSSDIEELREMIADVLKDKKLTKEGLRHKLDIVRDMLENIKDNLPYAE